jgi:hypothetical protein
MQESIFHSEGNAGEILASKRAKRRTASLMGGSFAPLHSADGCEDTMPYAHSGGHLFYLFSGEVGVTHDLHADMVPTVHESRALRTELPPLGDISALFLIDLQS